MVEHIKELCTQRNISNYRLSKLSGIPYSSLNTMLKHQHIPSMNNLIKICKGLGITLSQFFADTDKKLTPEQEEILHLWSVLDKDSQLLAKGYLYGLARQKPPIKYGDE